MPGAEPDPYQPIADYGAVGNLRTAALVGLNGSADWCCLPDLDGPSVFAVLLDDRRGGRFLLRPSRVHRREQRYLEHSNVLETRFESEGGQLVVTDFMPLQGSLEGRCGDSVTEPTLYRLLRAEGGPVEVELEWNEHRNEHRAANGDGWGMLRARTLGKA